MVRQGGILNCRTGEPGSNLVFSLYSLLFCFGSDSIYAVDPVT